MAVIQTLPSKGIGIYASLKAFSRGRRLDEGESKMLFNLTL